MPQNVAVVKTATVAVVGSTGNIYIANRTGSAMTISYLINNYPIN